MNRTVVLVLLYLLSSGVDAVPAKAVKTIWQIGEADNSAREFALAPQGYKDFIHKDFGWPDRFYLIGKSRPRQDWPYVLPGPADAWAGSGGLAGIRTQVLNILFDLKECPGQGNWRLVIDLLDVQSPTAPIFKVTVNGHAHTFHLKPGTTAKALDGQAQGCREQLVTIDLAPSMIHAGGNSIALTSIQGSWLVFDQVRLEGPTQAELMPVGSLFVRAAQAADYEVMDNGKRVQPLLLDVQHIEGTPDLTVYLDGQMILTTAIESGRSVLEAPMPALRTSKQSHYEIRVGQTNVQAGTVTRSGHALITPADYVDPLMGTAHSRWMIAPGPWMPFSMVKLSPDNQNTGWQSGYDPSIENVGGFSHIHEWTMSGLLMMPTTGPLKTRVGDQYQPDQGYRSRIDKAREQAGIG